MPLLLAGAPEPVKPPKKRNLPWTRTSVVADSKPAVDTKDQTYDFGFDAIANKAWRKDKGDAKAVPDFATGYETYLV